MIEIDNDIFYKNLHLTQTYCELQLKNANSDPATALRTFNPVYEGQELFSFKEFNNTEGDITIVNWNVNPILGNLSLYPDLFDEQLAYKKSLVDYNDNNRKFDGRILVAEIYQTVVDGASEVESKGFVDINDCPPIDTWFYKIWKNDSRWVFFSWVPQKFIEFADKAVAVNCVDCLTWYEDWVLREKVTSIKFEQSGSKVSFLKLINKLFK